MRFYGPVRVPEEAGKGKAKVTVSLPKGTDIKIAPATFEIPLADDAPAAK
jgi:hypothetical protein